MTNEELLKPRYKQINDWPFMNTNYAIGKIFLFTAEGYETGIISQYPHLFSKLEWWEERSLENMPQYVRRIKDIEESEVRLGQTLRVIAWQVDEDGKELYFTYEGDPQPDLGAYPYYYAPATEEEYLAQSKV